MFLIKGGLNMVILLTVLFIFCIQGCTFGIATHYVGKSRGHQNCFWWGFFLGLIGLIVVLCLNDNTTTSSNSDNVEALDKLQKLKENGTISEKEFEESKKKILSKL